MIKWEIKNKVFVHGKINPKYRLFDIQERTIIKIKPLEISLPIFLYIFEI